MGAPLHRLHGGAATVFALDRAMPGTAATSETTPRLRYVAGLDGLRALAVAAVVLYHAAGTAAPGGFIGVDVFFVLSGYLITSLLLDERARTGGIRLARFWARRARRLLPAVVVLIAVCVVAGAALHPGDLARTRADALASLLYVTNWHLIADSQSYFAQFGRPSLLAHLWSLAIEEQFYVLWPLALAAAAARVRRRWLVGAVAFTAVASAGLMAALYTPGHDPSRVYYGTDTRAAALLCGALLAFGWAPQRLRGDVGRGAAGVLDAFGIGALALLALAVLRAHDHDAWLYQGGLLAVAACAAVAIAVAAHPATRLGRALGAAPLRWVGERSYGIYLWHWPVLALFRPRVDVAWHGPGLVAAQVAATVALAALSYRFVERPIRTGRALRALRAALDARAPRQRLALVGSAAVATAGLFAWGLLAPSPRDSEAAARVAIAAGLRVAHEAPGTVAGRAAAARVLAVGDSVMLAAAPELRRRLGRRVWIDAAVGRQPSDIAARLRAYRLAGRLPQRVVVQVGDNGPLLAGDARRLRAALADVSRVVLVNVTVPRSWEGQVNGALPALAGSLPGGVVVDWHARATASMLSDGAHPTAAGQALYARLVVRALRAPAAASGGGAREPRG